MNSDILIKQYCKELRFGKNIYENYSKISATDYADFLARLLKMEIDHRELVRKNRNLKSAGFDVIKALAPGRAARSCGRRHPGSPGCMGEQQAQLATSPFGGFALPRFLPSTGVAWYNCSKNQEPCSMISPL
jgi:hypothetical protein